MLARRGTRKGRCRRRRPAGSVARCGATCCPQWRHSVREVAIGSRALAAAAAASVRICTRACAAVVVLGRRCAARTRAARRRLRACANDVACARSRGSRVRGGAGIGGAGGSGGVVILMRDEEDLDGARGAAQVNLVPALRVVHPLVWIWYFKGGARRSLDRDDRVSGERVDVAHVLVRDEGVRSVGLILGQVAQRRLHFHDCLVQPRLRLSRRANLALELIELRLHVRAVGT